MNLDRRNLIDALHRAMKLDVIFVPTFALVQVEGYYSPVDLAQPRCHPLETLLIGEAAEGDPAAQIAVLLGEHRDWVLGFYDRYRGAASADAAEGSPYQRGSQEAASEPLRRFLKS